MPKKKRPEKTATTLVSSEILASTITPILKDLAIALELLREALPILKPDAPLRWYKNDRVRDDIRKFLQKHSAKPVPRDST